MHVQYYNRTHRSKNMFILHNDFYFSPFKLLNEFKESKSYLPFRGKELEVVEETVTVGEYR